MGFHEACFSNCHFPYCPGDPDIIYNGCYTWTFNELIFSNDQFREIVDWLMPPWFMTCKNLFASNIAILFVCCILLLICTCWAFKPLYKLPAHQKKDVCAIVLGFITLFMLVVSNLINVSAIALFSSVAPHRKYMPMAYKNHFGYSFWLDFSVCIILSVSVFLTYLSTISKVIYYVGPKDPKYSDEMMLGRS
ncbi:hypothetical protein HELRODRAFT_166131 [Helobdella robusta]|uniref:Uncharacterized protein n=1 Tax=Helobdella robusta TaxID=6412 RepID=T1EXT9_HELRO|nr:hypothetical protein HELRODRAFT_166131 [Helobdella robusta]ESN90463.1 hypothetical protein HELRODRAFT_166131 [Helobdella robusta]